MDPRQVMFRRLEWAFTETEYRGTAPDRFRAYVERCWTDYRLHPCDYEAPCVAITQSSGFGKSRLLLELARTTSDEDGGSMGVLYVCARLEESTGYPKATPKLKEWLFEQDLFDCTSMSQLEDRLTDHLVAIYMYAQKHWPIGRTKWLELFQQPQPLDKHLATRLEKLEKRLRRKPQEWTAKLGKLTKDAATSKRLVILAVDEAATLITAQASGFNPLRLLQRSLVKANYRIASADTRANRFTGGIFGVLVDTNPEVYKLGREGNALLRDSSSRYSSVGPQSLFPPFVLSDTMDVLRKEGNIASSTTTAGDEIAAYRSILRKGEGERMKHLVTMGRPMWAGIFDSNERGNGTGDVLRLAARKLLVGCDPDNVNSYNEATMFGVASLLCRLGVRPRSSSPLASHAVNKFMAVLAHVNCANEGYVSIYASDPVLPLGAAYVWHAHNAKVLRRFILPQLKKLLMNDEVDVGGILETVVARVVLLLAVDWCVLVEENKGLIAAAKADAEFQLNYRTFSGQFVNVSLFMETLVTAKDGAEIPVKENGNTSAKKKPRKQFKRWKARWDDWQLGFSHFVTLEHEPNEDTLWFLLGRYAAGIFTHNQHDVYVVIPMFRKSQSGIDASPKTAKSEPDDENAMEMSMVLIRVEDSSHRGGYDAAKLLPVNVFSPVNPLHRKSCSQVIRVCMRLQEEVSEEFVYAERVECDLPTRSSEGLVECLGTPKASSLSYAFTYCICPISNPKIVDADTGRQLMDLMSSFGHPIDLVEGDLSLRKVFAEPVRRARRMSPLSKLAGDAELRTCASLALVRAPGPIQEEQRMTKRNAPPFDAKTRPKKKSKTK